MKIGIQVSGGTMDSDFHRNDGLVKQPSNCWKFSRTDVAWTMRIGFHFHVMTDPAIDRSRQDIFHKEATGAFGDYRRTANGGLSP
jgi:hypothetical protein